MPPAVRVLSLDGATDALTSDGQPLATVADHLTVVTAADTQDAREYLDDESFDFVVSTVDAIDSELVQSVRARQETVSFVLVTDDRVPGDELSSAVTAITRRARSSTADERDREQTLKTLHDAAVDIQSCESIEAVCERTVEAAESILDFSVCSVMLQEDGWFVPQSLSSAAPVDGARRMADDEGLAGKTYQNQQSYTVGDARSDDDSKPVKDDYRGGLSVPIGEHGIFQAVSAQPGDFDDTDIELAELLLAHTESTLDRLAYEQELRERRAVLERQNERLDEFASVISHDLRNPLNIAQSRLTLLAEECNSDHLPPTERALDRIESIVEDTLTLARQGTSVVETEPVQLHRLATECWAMVEAPDATFDIADEVTVEGDRDRLRHIFENLFRNAIEHGGDDVTIALGALDGEHAGFYIADDGPGVPEEDREQVFKAGYSSETQGTGFGLSIVAEIAAAHDWSVTVTESDTGGARFEFETE